MNNWVLMGLAATIGTWFMTALGAGTVVFFKNIDKNVMRVMYGFSAGVMIAASFWSLLQPALELGADIMSERWSVIVVSVGFLFGVIFLWLCDVAATHIYKSEMNSTHMLFLAVTLHNIPEGLAVGVAFGALNSANNVVASLAAAISVAVGVGIQNFPEGAAIALPMRKNGSSRLKSFMYGQGSGLVEPIAGYFGALLASQVKAILPFALSFAAGAMILVAVHELIPEIGESRGTGSNKYIGTFGIIAGFVIMMSLDNFF